MNISKITIYKYFIICLLIQLQLNNYSQNDEFSILTNLGIGSINEDYSTDNIAIGNSGIASSNFYTLNFDNPASLTSLNTHFPVFESSVKFNTYKININNNTFNNSGMNFNSFGIGIPINDKFAFGIQLKPYSKIGFEVNNSNKIADTIISNNIMIGDGNTYNTKLALAYEVLNNAKFKISLGLDGNFIFGNFDKTFRTEFSNNSIFSSYLNRKTSLSGFNVGLSSFIKYNINNETKLNFGIDYKTVLQLNSNEDKIIYTYKFSEYSVPLDTIDYINGVKSKISIPSKLKLGFTLELQNAVEISAQYSSQNWTNYEPTNQNFGNSSTIAFGIKYRLSEYFGNDSYFSKLNYKIGYQNTKSNLKYGNNIIYNTYSFGLGIPLRINKTSDGLYKSLSFLNIGTEIVNMNKNQNINLSERYVRYYIGISFMPQAIYRWFVKSKIE